MRFCNKQSGFTLIELIVIIAIVAVLAGIAVPNFLSYMPKYRLNGAARQVMGDLMAARMKAVSQNTTVTVAWVSNHEYKIGSDPPIDIWPNYHDVTIGSVSGGSFSSNSFSSISFLSRGTSNTGSIGLTNSTDSKKVTVSIAGRVKITDL